MSDYTITIPDTLYEKAQRVAQQTSQQVDDVIRTRLEGALDELLFTLPDTEKAELVAMQYLSDDTLWTIARDQMPKSIQERMAILMTKNTRGTITDVEYAELSALVERGNQLMLRKAQAMKYLTERGYTLRLDDLKPTDECHIILGRDCPPCSSTS
jgi:paraquat-inducible protein B